MNQRELFLRHVAQTSESPMLGIDINIVKAKGVKLTDVNGKHYTDLISGISVSSVGHCHPDVAKAVTAQSKKFMHLMVYGEFNQTPQVKYAEALCALLPASLNSVFFTSGGSEAVEGAMKLSKRATGRSQIVSFRNAYHGSTQGALSIMGDEELKTAYRPLIPGNTIIRFNHTEDLEQVGDETAAVIIEPVQGEAGIHAADESFLRSLREKCTKVGALLIFDEIQTGFGRTGTLFAFEKYGIVPDILLIAKGMGGGMPIGAFVASHSLMTTLSRDPALGHINTFGGNAVCVAAAHATLNIIVKHKLYERAAEIETAIKNVLMVRDTELRTSGALCALDFKEEARNMRVVKACLEAGIITDWFLFCPTAMRIAPPLTIKDTELRRALKKIASLAKKSK